MFDQCHFHYEYQKILYLLKKKKHEVRKRVKQGLSAVCNKNPKDSKVQYKLRKNN